MSFATWEAEPHIRFKAKGYITPEKRGPFYNGKSPIFASDARRWRYHIPLPKYKAKGYITPEKRGPFYNGKRLISASDDRRWQYHISLPLQFDRGGKFFFRDNK